jgi:hypothetical protein
MTNEELYLKERVGQKNPFRTPEGYFDQFTANIMAQLPERQPMENKSVAKKVAMPIRHWFYAAACVAALLVTAFSFHFHNTTDNQQQVAFSETYIDEAADYAMLDNTDIYQLLAEE